MDAIQSSWVWKSTKQRLRGELGRDPTDAEVEAETGIDPGFVLDGIPYRSSFLDSAEDAVLQTADSLSRPVDIDGDHDTWAAMLEQVLLGAGLTQEAVEEMMAYLGADRRSPRLDDDLAEHLGIGIRQARRLIAQLDALMLHPRMRVRYKRAIDRLGYGDAVEEAATDG